MKTLMPLTLAALALTVAALNTFAGDALLSPRAKENQIKTAPTAAEPNLAANQNLAGSPRALANQIKTVAGTSMAADAMVCSRNMTTSPKAISECASHPGAAMSCCAVASTK